MREKQKSVRAEPVEALPLISHSSAPSPVIDSFDVSIERKSPGQIWLRYHLEIPEEALSTPDPAEPQRADNLWQTTCFELFLRSPGKAAYAEFNFSPSAQWAAYRFDAEREGMAELDLPRPPDIGLDMSDSHFALETTLDLPPEWRGHDLDIGLAAVIETMDGSKSYWALAHPADRLDFHHPGSFTLRLPHP